MRAHRISLPRCAVPFAVACALVLAPVDPLGAQAPAALVATWEGDARIVDAPLDACRPSVRITVAPDGTVQGMVGEARLVRGHLVRNRGTLGRLFRMRTDWRIDAELDGPLLSSESVTRERIRMPFDLEEFELHGGFQAIGGGDAVAARFVLIKRRD